MGQAAGELQTSSRLWRRSVSRWDMACALPLAGPVSLCSAVNGASCRPRAPQLQEGQPSQEKKLYCCSESFPLTLVLSFPFLKN